jgi:hypothetical protein
LELTILLILRNKIRVILDSCSDPDPDYGLRLRLRLYYSVMLYISLVIYIYIIFSYIISGQEKLSYWSKEKKLLKIQSLPKVLHVIIFLFGAKNSPQLPCNCCWKSSVPSRLFPRASSLTQAQMHTSIRFSFINTCLAGI